MPFQLPMKYAHTAVSAQPSAGQPENNMSERAQARRNSDRNWSLLNYSPLRCRRGNQDRGDGTSGRFSDR
jgi:hypothetical protein